MSSLNKENGEVAVKQAVAKLMGLKSYTFYASERVYYSVQIQAHSLEEAWDKVTGVNMGSLTKENWEVAEFEIVDVELSETLGE